jgi:hypothetical protein
MGKEVEGRKGKWNWSVTKAIFFTAVQRSLNPPLALEQMSAMTETLLRSQHPPRTPPVITRPPQAM